MGRTDKDSKKAVWNFHTAFYYLKNMVKCLLCSDMMLHIVILSLFIRLLIAIHVIFFEPLQVYFAYIFPYTPNLVRHSFQAI